MRPTMFAAMAVAACVVALSGCNADDIPPSAGPPGTATSSSSGTVGTSSTPTPTKSLSPEEQDLRSAEEAISEYWRVIDEAASDPSQDLKVLATVARAQALAQWQTTLTTDRAQGLTQKGLSVVRDARGLDQGRQDLHRERMPGRLSGGRGRRFWQVGGAHGPASHPGLHVHGAEGTRGVLRHRGPAQGSVMRRLTIALLGVCLWSLTGTLAEAAPPVACPPGQEPHPKTGACTIVVTPPPDTGSPGEPGTPSNPGGGGSEPAVKPVCQFTLASPPEEVPCSSEQGWWVQSRQCYAKAAAPQPARSDPVWEGRTRWGGVRLLPAVVGPGRVHRGPVLVGVSSRGRGATGPAGDRSAGDRGDEPAGGADRDGP